MSRYRRAKGSTFFFTVVLEDRSSTLLVDQTDRFRRIYRTVFERQPFETIAICILPDHLHAIWTLPQRRCRLPLTMESDQRWIFAWPGGRPVINEPIEEARERHLAASLLEHAIRDDADLARHVDYIHFNPVKHGHVTRVRDWSLSSFHRYVGNGTLPVDWGGDMRDMAGQFGE